MVYIIMCMSLTDNKLTKDGIFKYLFIKFFIKVQFKKMLK